MGALDSRPPALRRALTVAWAVVFLGLVFVVIPFELAELNDERGWPRWRTMGGRVAGACLLAAGVGLSLHCSRLFARIGRGTPVPFDPPQRLVASGIYRFTRNPIYVAQVAILLSYFLVFGHLALLVHAAAWAILVQGFIVWIEEPGLRKRFGASYEQYTDTVPRWLGPRRGPR